MLKAFLRFYKKPKKKHMKKLWNSVEVLMIQLEIC